MGLVAGSSEENQPHPDSSVSPSRIAQRSRFGRAHTPAVLGRPKRAPNP